MWDKLKEHVKRNKSRYAMLAGAALGAGLGYAASEARKPDTVSEKLKDVANDITDNMSTRFGGYVEKIKQKNSFDSTNIDNM